MLQKIARNIQQAKFYSVMGDEAADISNKEQLILCIRQVNNDFQVYEDFIRSHKLPNTTADEIVKVMNPQNAHYFLKKFKKCCQFCCTGLRRKLVHLECKIVAAFT